MSSPAPVVPGPSGPTVSVPDSWSVVVADARVAAAIAGATVVRRIVHRSEVDSTQDVAAADAALGRFGTLVVADRQRVGRGRRGRTWDDGPGALASLRASVAMPDPGPARTVVPLAVGLAVAEAIVGVAPGTVTRLKWPNDVLVASARSDGKDAVARKCAGVLVERVPAAGPDGAALVIGIGLDLDWRRGPADRPWTSVAEVAGDVDPVAVLVALLGTLERRVADGSPSATPAEVLAASRARSATLGRVVEVVRPGGERLVGTAVGIDDLGRLEVQREGGGRVAIDAGDVEHRVLTVDGP